jgi:predicted nuclease with TOPRIM domain
VFDSKWTELDDKIEKLEKELAVNHGIKRTMVMGALNDLYKDRQDLLRLEWSTCKGLDRFKVLRKLVEYHQRQLNAFKYELQQLEEKCKHQFGEPVRLSERIYDMEGNVKWQRTCKLCAKVEETRRYEEQKVEVPVFPP